MTNPVSSAELSSQANNSFPVVLPVNLRFDGAVGIGVTLVVVKLVAPDRADVPPELNASIL